jgi:hypothetical protein
MQKLLKKAIKRKIGNCCVKAGKGLTLQRQINALAIIKQNRI